MNELTITMEKGYAPIAYAGASVYPYAREILEEAGYKVVQLEHQPPTHELIKELEEYRYLPPSDSPIVQEHERLMRGLIKEHHSHSQRPMGRGTTEKQMGNQPPIDEQAFMEEYMRPKSVNVAVVKKYGRLGVITQKGGIETFGQGDKQEHKPFIVVQLKGKDFKYFLSPKQAAKLTDDFGTMNRAEWVGKKLLFDIETTGFGEYVKAAALPVDPTEPIKVVEQPPQEE